MRMVFFIGDALNRLARHPRAFFATMFGFILITVTLGVHFKERWDGGRTYTLGWGDAVLVGLFGASLGTFLAYAFYWREDKADS